MDRKIVLLIGAVLAAGMVVICAIGAGLGGLAWFWAKPPAAVAVDDSPSQLPPPTEPPAVDLSPRPELAVTIRQPDALVGEPVMVSVRLRNAGALAAAHATDAKTLPQTLELQGNWRNFIELEVSRLSANGQSKAVAVEAVPLGPEPPQPESAIGVRTLAAAWAFSPDSTAQWQPGNYRVSVRLRAEGLLPRKFPDLAAQADFLLAEPDGSTDLARLNQAVAFYHLQQNNCDAVLTHARKAIELNPGNNPAYWYAAECLIAAGQTTEAATMLDLLLTNMPPELHGSDYHAAVKMRLARLQSAN